MSTPLYDLVINNLTANNYPPTDASTLITGIVNTAVLGTGTANSSTILYGDSTWRLPSSNVVATSAEFLQGNTVQTNSTVLIVGVNVAINTSAVFVGNSTINTVMTAGQITLSGISINSTAYGGTSNNTTFAYGKTEGALNVNSAITALTSNNSTNFDGQPASYYTNASNLTTGTVPLARLDANVILTTSATGINASALSIGTVPIARLPEVNSSASGIVNTAAQSISGAKTFLGGITANGVVIPAGAGLTANGSLGTAGWILTTNGSSPYWAASSGSVTIGDVLALAIALG